MELAQHAEESRLSVSSVQRIWRAFGLQLMACGLFLGGDAGEDYFCKPAVRTYSARILEEA
ncbi:hypothetical protein [Bradyrhizobium cenepequi]|uniref:hypothetical protein n=1 Tax=Bradyrhizobium cenepequi TaxID=2821403 RepID=UPI001CE2A7E5|nr:hypothetical protein [Bradyrhizobium cenepequi]MCA6108062.1 hypothetical protein [Bradyrhizobium cenepequi]